MPNVKHDERLLQGKDQTFAASIKTPEELFGLPASSSLIQATVGEDRSTDEKTHYDARTRNSLRCDAQDHPVVGSPT